mgnify:CR=1 FL=1
MKLFSLRGREPAQVSPGAQVLAAEFVLFAPYFRKNIVCTGLEGIVVVPPLATLLCAFVRHARNHFVLQPWLHLTYTSSSDREGVVTAIRCNKNAKKVAFLISYFVPGRSFSTPVLLFFRGLSIVWVLRTWLVPYTGSDVQYPDNSVYVFDIDHHEVISYDFSSSKRFVSGAHAISHFLSSFNVAFFLGGGFVVGGDDVMLLLSCPFDIPIFVPRFDFLPYKL